MIEIEQYLDKNIESVDANIKDKNIYYQIKKATCEKYVKKYFGGWNEEEQKKYNNKIFDESLKQNCFKIIKVANKPVGFFGYSIFDREIGCVTIQIITITEKNKIFNGLLNYLFALSNKLNLPIYAKSFLASKDVKLYKKAGFKIMETTKSHYLLKREI